MSRSDQRPRGVVPRGVPSTDNVRGRGERVLAALGLETALDTIARLGTEGKETAASALREWVNVDLAAMGRLLDSLPKTRGGRHSRRLRVAMCGVAFVARIAGLVGYARRWCKDRLCPFCSARRSRRFAASLREALAVRPWQWRRFVTLTQVKLPGETAAQAVDRVLAAWRRFTERFARRMLAGGVRALELTARQRAGVANAEGYTPQAGIHAHLHTVLDLVGAWPGVECLRRPTKRNRRGDLGWHKVSLLAAAWEASSPGAMWLGVDVQEVTDENVYQVAKYPVDMSGLLEVLDGAPGYVRAVVTALHGRRMVAAFGGWRGIDLGLRESKGRVEYGDRSITTLVTNAPDARDAVVWCGGEHEQAETVLARLLASIAAGHTAPLSGGEATAGA